MKLIKDYWQILVALVSVTFGYANFTAKIEAHEVKLKTVDAIYEKVNRIEVMVERIDERTSRRK